MNSSKPSTNKPYKREEEMKEQVRKLQKEGWILLRITEDNKAVMQAPNDWSSGGYTIHIVVHERGIIGRYTSHHVPPSRRKK